MAIRYAARSLDQVAPADPATAPQIWSKTLVTQPKKLGHAALEATVTLRDSPFDPIADLPVREVVSFAHQRYDHLMTRPGGGA